MIGRIGPDYEIIRELRRGPWVTVYEARHRVLGRRTLIKWLNPEHKGDEEMAGRLRREARLGASVDHPNAARIYGVGEADGRPFVAIEWIEGEDLESMLEREGQLPLPRVIKLAKDLLNGLTAIHEAGVVHRDLSPANVRMTATGLARITDFGLATGRYDPRFTIPGAVVGTPGYLAPEQASGKEIDARADIFAAGVLLHEALTGKTLFKDKDLIHTLKRVRTEDAPVLDTILDNLPEGFSEWIAKLLEKDRENRWNNASDALAALLELITEKEEEPEAESQPRKKPAWFKIPATLLPAIALALLLATLIQIIKPSQESPIEPPDLVPGEKQDSVFKEYNTEDTTDIDAERQQEKPLEVNVEENNLQNTPEFTGVRTVDTDVASRYIENEVTPELESESSEISQKDILIENNSPVEMVDNEIATPDSGILVVQSRPWAEIQINDSRIGNTPGLRPVKLPQGDVRITFINPGFPPIVMDTTIYALDTTNVSIELISRTGIVFITVDPWAYLYIDDILAGETPLTRPLYLSPGKHVLRFTHPRFGEVNREIMLSSGDSLELSVDMLKEGTAFARNDSVKSP